MLSAAPSPDGSLPSGPRIVGVYLTTSAVFTLATSLIWGVNTLFLLDAGLDIFGVMVVNGSYSVGQVLFEVPTGVVADTIGRKASFLFGIATLFVSTIIYLAASSYGWGIGAFIAASVLLGLGFTFQTGAVDAWLVDALDFVGYDMPRETVFARGGIVMGVAMLVGTLAGGFLGQVSLATPYLMRAGLLAVCFVATLLLMHEVGFEPRPLKASRFGAETRVIFDAGVRYGWRDPVVRPLLFVSALEGTFMMYMFYASQPFALDLLGRPDLVWVAGAITAMFALTGVIGNACVGLVMRTRWKERPGSVLALGSLVSALFVAAIALVGLFAPEGGSAVSFAAMVGAFALAGILSGIVGPIRQAYINKHIPTAQRATVLSLDSFFSDAGGAIGQPAFGWIARVLSIPAGYLVGSVFMAGAFPLYRRSQRAAQDQARLLAEAPPATPPPDETRLLDA